MAFSKDEVVVIPPTLKDKPKWYEASHNNGVIKCPGCGVRLKVQTKSLWPLVFVVPGFISAVVLPTPYGYIGAAAITGASAFLAVYTIKYEAGDF